jgi:citronellyl-CoA dehydrogenase
MIYGPDHQALMQSIRRFVAEQIDPHVDEWEAAETFPAHALFRQMGALGFLGITKPEAYGGQGLDFSYAVAAAEAMGYARAQGVAMAIGVQANMATPALASFGSDELRRQFLTPAIAGEMVACIGVSEQGAGSDVASIQTRARKDGDDYIIDGAKMWITNGLQGDWVCLLCNTSEGAPHKSKSLSSTSWPNSRPSWKPCARWSTWPPTLTSSMVALKGKVVHGDRAQPGGGIGRCRHR